MMIGTTLKLIKISIKSHVLLRVEYREETTFLYLILYI